jgi:hypothetical protein
VKHGSDSRDGLDQRVDPPSSSHGCSSVSWIRFPASDRAFCRTRAGLELRIRELIGREHQAALAHLPDWHPDVGRPDRLTLSGVAGQATRQNSTDLKQLGRS